MEITASCIYDLKALTALLHLQMFKKSSPQKCIIFWMVSIAVVFAVLLLEIIFWEADMIFLAALLVAALLLMCYSYFWLPRISYKAQAKMKNAENSFVFGQQAVRITSRTAQYEGEAHIEYTLFVKVFETSEYFFLFQTKNQAYIVDKATIRGGTAKDIRSRLTPAVKKYVTCKY